MSFLNLEGKRYLVMGVANRKSVAWAIAKTLEAEGAEVIFSVRSESRLESVQKLLGDRKAYICDVEDSEAIQSLAASVAKDYGTIDGLVHSIAFANYSKGMRPFHETDKADFLHATTISSFSLVEVANAFKSYFSEKASVVSIGISSTEGLP